MANYRYLEAGEIIQDGDEVDAAKDVWRDPPDWRPTTRAGKRVPDPRFSPHSKYRRRIEEAREPRRKCRTWINWLLWAAVCVWLACVVVVLLG